MKFDEVLFHIDHSPTLRLLRSEYASLALSFFHAVFKKQNQSSYPYPTLQNLLATFLENLDEKAREVHGQSADHYLALWCDERHRFLHRYYDREQDEPLVELTYDTERALEWMCDLEEHEFVGAQSRFYAIFEALKTIAEKTQVDPAKRIQQLKSKKKGIEKEIEQIQLTGKVERLDETQVKELFLNLLDDARRLTSDFRLIEDVFKDLTRKVKEEKLKDHGNRGTIVGNVLDSYEYLEGSDQGKSFNAFWRFLISTEQQELFREYLEISLRAPEIQDLIAKNKQRSYDQALKQLKPRLLQAGQKTLRSKSRLSEELRRLLHQKALQENHQAMAEIHEIKKEAFNNRENFQTLASRVLFDLSYLPQPKLPMERPLWTNEKETVFSGKSVEDAKVEFSAQDAEALLRPRNFIDLEELRNRIRLSLEKSDQIRLAELVGEYPISHGIAEVIAYMGLAMQFPHAVDPNKEESLPFRSNEYEGEVKIPLVIYSRTPEESAHACYAQ